MKDFTEKAWQAIVQSLELAREAQNQIVETEHLMKALLEQPNGLARRIISKAGGNPSDILDKVNNYIARQPRVFGDSGQVLGRNLEAAVAKAEAMKKEMNDEFVSVEHLLLGLAEDPRVISQLLRSVGLDEAKLKNATTEIRGSNRVTDQDPEGKYEALSRYARDLTAAAREGKLDPVIGRDDEIRRCIQILSRRTKNNPVLIGEPGVGKTAVAEGKVPHFSLYLLMIVPCLIWCLVPRWGAKQESCRFLEDPCPVMHRQFVTENEACLQINYHLYTFPRSENNCFY